MTTKRVKSNEARRDWAELLQFVRTGGTVIVEHYNKPIATIAPYEEPAVTCKHCGEPIQKRKDEDIWFSNPVGDPFLGLRCGTPGMKHEPQDA